jgi:hypothetical protein
MKTLVFPLALSLILAQPCIVLAVDGHPHGHEAGSGLKLNDGRKWMADKHTVDSVAAMKAGIEKAAVKAPTTSVAELHTLGQQLQEQLQALIRGCTMTGAAHDQLHSWIGQLAPEIQSLIQSSDATAGVASVERISDLLRAFDEHFERGVQS